MDELSKEKKHVLVIGNGFDLDIGLKTTYMSFAESTYWPFNKPSIAELSLGGFLNTEYNCDSWFDLEMLLAEYGSKERKCKFVSKYKLTIEEEKSYFRLLCTKLSQYLTHEQKYGFVDNQSIASILLSMFSLLKGEKKVYSFNYTDLEILGKRMGLEKVPHCYHIHGSLKDDDIILGASDKMDLDESFNFLYKSSSHNFHCNEIIPDLEDADNIVIFGHSLSENDYDYFEDFFIEACKRRKGAEYKRRITIITKDESSELEIKSHIRFLTNRHIQRLVSVCDFKVICTDNIIDILDFLVSINNEFPDSERPFNLPETVKSLKDFERNFIIE